MTEPLDLTLLGPAERYRAVAARFNDVVRATNDWQAATPVAGWVARDVVAHLVGWFPAFLASGGVELTAAPDPQVDPVQSWQVLADGVQALLDDTDRATSLFTHPYAGTHRLDEAVDRFFTADVFMHTWDLARASGVEPQLDERFCAVLVETMQPIEAMLRSSGHYGPQVPVADDADPVTRLIAFIGRDPNWMPHGSDPYD